ncbi:hypothetical protein GY45DRAFT_1401669 [Cubamyces sp. BRFM 1775]|nr:hypothetical protein GY45DRAFT_1401669 [Cubamyces sp. BRFM 1775]
MASHYDILRAVVQSLEPYNIGLSDLLILVLVQARSDTSWAGVISELARNTTSLLAALYHHDVTGKITRAWMHQTVQTNLLTSIQKVAGMDGGWHFNAAHAHSEQINNFRIEDMTAHVRKEAPELWSFVNGILSSGTYAHSEPAASQFAANAQPTVEADADEEYWDSEDVDALENIENVERDADRAVAQGRGDKKKAIVIISVFLHNEDQHCNLLQSTMGIFLHSCSAPEKLIKILGRMGLSISLSSIHRALKSLSQNSHTEMEALGRTLRSGIGYDNFDFKLDIAVPTIDSLKDTLFHMTSGTLLRLDHGVTSHDLRCSQLLWNRSELNPLATDPRLFDPRKTLTHLQSIHREPDTDSTSRRGRFRSWLLQHMLFKHGPPALKQLIGNLRDPESIESIPVVKLHHVPLRAMDINQSKVSGNIEALGDMLCQAGLGDPASQMGTRSGAPVADISDYAVLVHGDLGTYERVLTAQRRRQQELTPYNRLQYLVFVPGLFHLKMAAADAIWRALVTTAEARVDPTSFAKLMAKLRPNESSRLINNAKFRQQHELIEHVGAILILDAWRTELKRSTGGRVASLEQWAETKPSMYAISEIAEQIVLNYVEGDGLDLFDMQFEDVRDVARENTMRTLNYLLLYEELAYAMNAGDIGRVETLYAPWIQIFRATGKHKYGNLMLPFAHALYFVYPEELQ